uniref:Protein kinase domain-containing protein n=1 Tax=Panagrolaimus sp. JU765 TaxID=591449 RepID=A0AC34RC44_9BILA
MTAAAIGYLEVFDGEPGPTQHRYGYNLRATPQRLHRATIQLPLPIVKKQIIPSTTSIIRKFGYYTSSKMTLGAGQFSKVYKATKTNHNYAIKTMKLSALRKEYMEKFVKREIDCLKILKHPNICQMYAQHEYGDVLLLVLEFCEYGDLLSYLMAHGALSYQVGQYWMTQVCDALVYIHSLGIAHRDVKAENVLISRNHQVKLSDFGFACQTTSPSRTFCGSISYCSPQILAGKSYNVFKSDVWSLGILIFISMIGKMPYHNERDKFQVLQQMQFHIFNFDPCLPPECLQTMRSLLVFDENDRPFINQVRSYPFFLSLT